MTTVVAQGAGSSCTFTMGNHLHDAGGCGGTGAPCSATMGIMPTVAPRRGRASPTACIMHPVALGERAGRGAAGCERSPRATPTRAPTSTRARRRTERSRVRLDDEGACAWRSRRPVAGRSAGPDGFGWARGEIVSHRPLVGDVAESIFGVVEDGRLRSPCSSPWWARHRGGRSAVISGRQRTRRSAPPCDQPRPPAMPIAVQRGRMRAYGRQPSPSVSGQ